MHRLPAYIALTRPKFLILSILPVVLSTFLAQQAGYFSWPLFLWCLAGVMLLHASGNVANDCYDFVQGADTVDTTGRYSGGSGVLARGLLSVREAQWFFSILGALALGIALWISKDRGVEPFLLSTLGLTAALFYTLPPLKLAYRGLGEITVALAFGPGTMTGTYLVITGSYSNTVLIASCFMGLLIGTVLFLNELRDVETDRAVGKHNLAVRYTTWNAK